MTLAVKGALNPNTTNQCKNQGLFGKGFKEKYGILYEKVDLPTDWQAR